MLLNFLIVDPHEESAVAVSLLLRSQGHRTSIAIDYRSALVLAQSEPFDVLLAGFTLPDGKGSDLLAEVSSIRPTLGVGILDQENEQDRARMERVGFAVVLVKPVSAEELYKVVASAPLWLSIHTGRTDLPPSLGHHGR